MLLVKDTFLQVIQNQPVYDRYVGTPSTALVFGVSAETTDVTVLSPRMRRRDMLGLM